jgi:tight adherence protein B
MRIHTSRARVRTAARVITGVTVAMAAGLIALGGNYLDPYDTPIGQVVLAIAFGCTALGLVWLHRLATAAPPASFLRQEAAREGASS